jgi:hypothetical protein
MKLKDNIEDILEDLKDDFVDHNRCWNGYVSKVMELLKYMD